MLLVLDIRAKHGVRSRSRVTTWLSALSRDMNPLVMHLVALGSPCPRPWINDLIAWQQGRPCSVIHSQRTLKEGPSDLGATVRRVEIVRVRRGKEGPLLTVELTGGMQHTPTTNGHLDGWWSLLALVGRARQL